MKKSMLLGGICLFLNSIHVQAIPIDSGVKKPNCLMNYGSCISTKDPAIERMKKEQNCITITTNHPRDITPIIVDNNSIIGSNKVTICGDNKYEIRDRICSAITCY